MFILRAIWESALNASFPHSNTSNTIHTTAVKWKFVISQLSYSSWNQTFYINHHLITNLLLHQSLVTWWFVNPLTVIAVIALFSFVFFFCLFVCLYYICVCVCACVCVFFLISILYVNVRNALIKKYLKKKKKKKTLGLLSLLLRALPNKMYILSQKRLHKAPYFVKWPLCFLYEVAYCMIQFQSVFHHFGLTFWQYFLTVLPL